MRSYLLLLFVLLTATGIQCKKDHDNDNSSQALAQLQGDWRLIAQSGWVNPTPVIDSTEMLRFIGNIQETHKSDTLFRKDTFRIVYVTEKQENVRYPCLVNNGETEAYLAFTVKHDTLQLFTINVVDGGSATYVNVPRFTAWP